MAFVRTVKVKSPTGKIQEYVRIVEAYWENKKPKQRVIANLGNIVSLKKDIRKIINGLLKVSGEDKIFFADEGKLKTVKEYGVKYVTEKIWEELGIGEEIKKNLQKTKGTLDYENWILMMVVNKLSDPCSKLGIFRWLKGVWWPNHNFDERVCSEELELGKYIKLCKKEVMKFYRAMDYLIKMKKKLENHLYNKLSDLFSLNMDLVFYDVTSSYFEGGEADGFKMFGYSRDKKPGKLQIVIGLIMCNGLPIGHEVFEGNRLDKKTVKEVIKKLKEEFKINRCIFVGDRGLITDENIEDIEKNGFDSILALRRRRAKEAKKILIGDGEKIFCRESEELEWREVNLPDGTRYIVCRNPKIAEETRKDREENLKKLEVELNELTNKVNSQKKPKIKTIVKEVENILKSKHGSRYFNYKIDEKERKLKFYRKEEAIKLEEALDGVYILRTKEKKIEAVKIIEAYKELTDIERSFRMMKSVLDIRPYFHRLEDRIRAHTFICYLAYLIFRYIERKMKADGFNMSGERAFETLKHLSIGVLEIGDEQKAYVCEPSVWQQRIFKSLGLKPPPRIMTEKN